MMQAQSIGRRVALATLIIVASSQTADATCALAAQGDGHVGAILDARTFRLSDGRDIRLAGIEPAFGQDNASAPLAALIADRDVSLQGADDAPDRYGRQSAFVFPASADTPVQIALLKRGQAVYSGLVTDKSCAADLIRAEADARNSRLGVWAEPTAIKNAEKPEDILSSVGQFVVVEGKVLSVRQTGTTFYVNFGRRWTEGFAVTISRRMIAPLETAGLAPKSLENRRLRVRGWVERRGGGPRIELFQAGQIELAGDK